MRSRLARSCLVALALALPARAGMAETPQPKPDPWALVRFLAGEWEGTAEGQGGKGTARRGYAFVL